MLWVDDLSSIVGIPAGAATFAVAIYGACSAAEKAARRGALDDIGRVLKDPSWSRSARPSKIIGRVFGWTFGEHHFSCRCLLRSLIATTTFTIATGLVYWELTKHWLMWTFFSRLNDPVFYRSRDFTPPVFGIVFCAVIPDFFSLLKTRLLFRRLEKTNSLGVVAAVIVIDIVGAMIISMLSITPWLYLTNHFVFHGEITLYITLTETITTVERTIGLVNKAPYVQIFGVMFWSTALTVSDVLPPLG
jgi:hypothetical protein